ncbi:MAG TPA: hypothetical protein VNW15_07825 [Rhizomicrobium sp.]|jgi:hypothetical protein|nr:hypothetical protein [Rhizomicrobium sp.]
MTRNRELEDLVAYYYGINSRTFEIELVSLTSGGWLQKLGTDHSSPEFRIRCGRSPQGEIERVWGLLDTFSFSAAMCESAFVKKQLDKLRLKALARMRDATRRAAKDPLSNANDSGEGTGQSRWESPRGPMVKIEQKKFFRPATQR